MDSNVTKCKKCGGWLMKDHWQMAEPPISLENAATIGQPPCWCEEIAYVRKLIKEWVPK